MTIQIEYVQTCATLQKFRAVNRMTNELVVITVGLQVGAHDAGLGSVGKLELVCIENRTKFERRDVKDQTKHEK
jgi:hypothetical protein